MIACKFYLHSPATKTYGGVGVQRVRFPIHRERVRFARLKPDNEPSMLLHSPTGEAEHGEGFH